jgi:hypothetical protein
MKGKIKEKMKYWFNFILTELIISKNYLKENRLYYFAHFLSHYYFAFYWYSFFFVLDEERIFHPLRVIKKFELNYFTRALCNILDTYILPHCTSLDEATYVFAGISLMYSVILVVFKLVTDRIEDQETYEKVIHIRDIINDCIFCFSTICGFIACAFFSINLALTIYFIIT